MAKLSIQRLMEVSKLLATDAGQQLQDALTFLNDVSDQVLRALRNGLTFRDNFNCQIAEAELSHDVESLVNTGSNRAVGIIPLRVSMSNNSGSTKSAVSALVWYINNQGKLTVKVSFSDAPTDSRKVQLLILFE